MKGLKKLLTGILAATLVMGMSTTAFAAVDYTTNKATFNPAEGDGSITIQNAVIGQKYELYKLFDFERASDDGGVYKVRDEWKEFAKSQTAYVAVDANNVVTWVNTDLRDGDGKKDDDTAVTAFAKEAQKNTAGKTVFAYITAEGDEVGKTTTISFEGLDLGYYMVKSSLGVIVSLDTTNKAVTMVEKNDVPNIDKKEDEDSEGQKIEYVVDDQEIGKPVHYKTVVNAKKGGTNYKVHDVMTAGLTFDPTTVAVDNLPSGITYVLKTGDAAEIYDEKATPQEKDTFTIVFVKADAEGNATEELAVFEADVDIEITYTAYVNEATKVLVMEENKTYLEYNNKARTGEKFTRTYAYKFKIFKYYKNGDNKEKLPGAVFKVENTSDDEGIRGRLNVVLETAGSANTPSIYRLASKKDIAEKTLNTFANDEADIAKLANADRPGAQTADNLYDYIITPGSGEVVIRGVDADTYSLTELLAPEGYNILEGPVSLTVSRVLATGKDIDDDLDCLEGFTINNSKTIKSDEEAFPGEEVREIENNSGAILPSTGGIGTTIFYIVGALLICAAVVFMIMKRKGAQAE